MSQRKPNRDAIDPIAESFADAVMVLREQLTRGYTEPMSARAEQAIVAVETFGTIALRIMRDSSVSKIREHARIEEIKAHMERRAT